MMSNSVPSKLVFPFDDFVYDLQRVLNIGSIFFSRMEIRDYLQEPGVCGRWTLKTFRDGNMDYLRFSNGNVTLFRPAATTVAPVTVTEPPLVDKLSLQKFKAKRMEGLLAQPPTKKE